MADTNMSECNNNGVVSWTSQIEEDYDENACDDESGEVDGYEVEFAIDVHPFSVHGTSRKPSLQITDQIAWHVSAIILPTHEGLIR